MTTPQDLREQVISALIGAPGFSTLSMAKVRNMADAAIAVVIAECDWQCSIVRNKYLFHSSAIARERCISAGECASAISALKLPPATEGDA